MANRDKLDIDVHHYSGGGSSSTVKGGATISRKRLIKIAFETLDMYDVNDSDRGHLLYAACTMKRVALSSWAIDKHCGCLVGTMLLDQGYKAKDIDGDIFALLEESGRDVTLEDLGSSFDEILRQALIVKYGLDDGYYFASQSVKVKD